MSGPENETPKETPVAAKTPAAAKKAATPKSSAASAPSAEAPSGTGGGASTAQATAAVSNAVSVVRERLVAGEQMALSGAGLVAAVWIIFDLIFDFRTVSQFTLLVAVLMILAIWVHRWGHYDFGNGYRIVIGALGIGLLLFAVTNFLLVIRTGINAGALQLLGLLLFWVGGVVAGYGAWLVFRVREDDA